MANEFKIRKGYKALSSSEITGSLKITEDLTVDGTIYGINVLSSSLQIAGDISGSFTSTSSSLALRVKNQEDFSSSLDVTFATDNELSASSAGVSSSLAIDIALNTSTGSDQEGRLDTLEGKTLLSGSAQIASDISGSITIFSGSIAGRVKDNEDSLTSINGVTSSFLLNTTDTLTGDLTVTGTLTAQEFHTEYVSSSILHESGSTVFGNTADDTHNFTGSLNLDGTATITGDIGVTGAYYDSGNTPGTVNQVLTSTETGTSWVDPNTISAAPATLVVIACKNTSGATITKGTPVYQTGTVGSTAVIEIAPADALISANKLPAIGLLQTDLNNNGQGNVVITGELTHFTTSPIDGVVPTTGDKVFVKSGGGLTLTKPTGEGNGIQNMGLVGKVSGGAAGSLTVSSIMRTNDVPNLPEGRIWVGDGNTIVSDTVYVDEPNNRVGIGTTSPDRTLTVNGNGAFLAGNELRFYNTANSNWAQIQSPASGVMQFSTGGGVAMYMEAAGNVGIGTTSPGHKLEVNGDTRTNSLFINTSSNIAGSIFTIANSSTATSINVNAFYDINRENAVDTPTVSTYGTVNRITVPSDFSNRLVVTQNNVARSTGASDLTGLYPSFNQSSVKGTGTVDYAIAGYNEASLDNADGTVNYLWGTHTEVQLKAGTVGNISLLNFDFDQTAGTTITGDFQYIQISNDQPVSNITGTARALNIESDLPSFFSGSIGIGTNSPNYKLDIEGADLIRAYNPSGSASIQIKASANNNSSVDFADPDDTNVGQIIYRHVDNSMSFDTNDIEKMRITSGGNVGIGTDNPSARLEVSSNDTVKTAIHIDNTSTGGNRWDIASIGSDVSGRVGNLQIRNDSDTLNIVEITGAGNVGIGTENPQAPLVISNSSTDGLEFHNSISSNSRIISYKRSNNTFRPLRLEALTHIFGISGNEKMRIDSSGKVGIGITNPTGKLTVVSDNEYNSGGGLRLQSSSSADRTLLYFSTSQSNEVSTIQSYRDGTGNGVRPLLLNPQGGNVGIGTTSPLAKLQVNSITASTMSQVAGEAHIVGVNHDLSDTQMGTLNLTSTSRDAGTNNQAFGPSLTFSQNASKYVDGFEVVIGGIKTELMYTGNMNKSSIMNFYTHTNSGLTPKMSIDADGNVGIGTTSPSEKLDVAGNILASGTILGSNLSGTNTGDQTLPTDFVSAANGGTFQAGITISNTFPFLDFVDTNSFTDTDDRFRVRAGVNQGLLQWYDASEASTQTVMSLSPNGDVDIVGDLTADNFSGTSSGTNTGDQDLSGYALAADYLLDTTDTLTGTLTIANSNFTGLILTRNSANGSSIDFNNSDGLLGRAGFLGDGTFAITNDTIGTYNMLHLDASGNATFTANISAVSITETSARKFKDNIVPLESQLDNIGKLNPVSFNWKKDNKQDIGLIAEEVAEVYPEMVRYEEEEVTGVNYSKLTATLIKAIQEQQKQIDELKVEITTLKSTKI